MDGPLNGHADGDLAFARAEIDALQDALSALRSDEELLETLIGVARMVVRCLRAGGVVYFCGNGGSAADAQHLAAELVGKQNFDRPPTAGVALTVDSSALTAIGNDYGFDHVFSRQITALGRPGDVLFGLSTSGRSTNVVNALAAASERGLTTVAFTGSDPRAMAKADWVLPVPATRTAKIQELHITSGHIVFALVELELFGEGRAAGAVPPGAPGAVPPPRGS
jgi:D-sedoheptulose 7-phosphate isomerase